MYPNIILGGKSKQKYEHRHFSCKPNYGFTKAKLILFFQNGNLIQNIIKTTQLTTILEMQQKYVYCQYCQDLRHSSSYNLSWPINFLIVD